MAQVIAHRAVLYRPSRYRPSFVAHRFLAAMPKTMKQMKAIFKKHLKERVRVHRAVVVAHQAFLQAQHEQVLMQAAGVGNHDGDDGDVDDEWLIAFEYENEEWGADE